MTHPKVSNSEPCDVCGGSGKLSSVDKNPCNICGGSGTLYDEMQNFRRRVFTLEKTIKTLIRIGEANLKGKYGKRATD